MRSNFYLALSVFLVLFSRASGQPAIYLRDSSIKVYAYGQQRSLAWCGGFNNPQFAMGDLNNDGLPDLVIFEPWNSLRTFINEGTPGNPNYVYAPQYELNFPPVTDFLNLSDYNCDGIPDLFSQYGSYIYAYSGYYNSANQLCFNFYKALYYTDSAYLSGPVNCFNNPNDIPALVDVDNDGDIDLLSYDIGGGHIYWYRNMRVEWGLPCDSISLVLQDSCWGRFARYDTSIIFNTCIGSGDMGNTLCLLDYDYDGDYDYLDGNIFYNGLVLGINGKIPYNPSGIDSMTSQDSTWQSGGHIVNLPSWPAPFNVDIDNDGNKDLLVSPNLSETENYNCIWYYKNFSTYRTADWRFQSDSFLTDQTIDLGTAAYPLLYDYNKDGKPDLIIGSDGYYQDSNGLLRSRLSLYQNTSVAGSPSFTLTTTDLLNIGSFNFQGAAPAIGDINNDGLDDLIIGHTDGTLSYFKNTAGSNTVQPVWTPTELTLTDVSHDTINVGGYAAPFVYDVNGDGKKDLIIGSVTGAFTYYQNVSTTPGILALQWITDSLGGVVVDHRNEYYNYSTPFVGPVDSTGVVYLLSGSGSGNIYRYGIITGSPTAAYTMLDSTYSYIDTFCNAYDDYNSSRAVFTDRRSAMTIGDIAGDGSRYMIVGNTRGGVELYKLGHQQASKIMNAPAPEMEINIFPNPAGKMLTVKWSNTTASEVQLTILDMAGRQLYTTTAIGNQADVPVSALPDGLYICALQNGTNRYYRKFTVVR